jgi:hypothetical protein
MMGHSENCVTRADVRLQRLLIELLPDICWRVRPNTQKVLSARYSLRVVEELLLCLKNVFLSVTRVIRGRVRSNFRSRCFTNPGVEYRGCRVRIPRA